MEIWIGGPVVELSEVFYFSPKAEKNSGQEKTVIYMYAQKQTFRIRKFKLMDQ